MRRGVQAKKQKKGTTILIAVGLNVVVWGGLATLFTIHKIAQAKTYDVSMVAMKQAAFKPVKPPEDKKVKVKAKAAPKAAKKGGAHKDSGPPHPHFMATAPDANGSGGSGQTVAAGGSGKAGQLFNNAPPKSAPPANPPKTAPPAKSPPVVTKPPAETKQTESPPPVVLHKAPMGETRDATPVDPVLPEIPSELRTQTLATQVTVQVSVDESGASSVSLVSSCGNERLDKLVLDAVKKWKWNPAVAEGVPIPALFQYTVKLKVN